MKAITKSISYHTFRQEKIRVLLFSLASAQTLSETLVHTVHLSFVSFLVMFGNNMLFFKREVTKP